MDCPRCKGNGFVVVEKFADGDVVQECPTCHGHGYINVPRTNANGMFRCWIELPDDPQPIWKTAIDEECPNCINTLDMDDLEE